MPNQTDAHAFSSSSVLGGYVYLFPDLMREFGLVNTAREKACEITFALVMRMRYFAHGAKGSKGVCYASRGKLAASVGRCATQVDMHLRRLESKGLIERAEGFKFAFRLTEKFRKAVEEALRKLKSGEGSRYFLYSPALAEAGAQATQAVPAKERGGKAVAAYRQRDVKGRVTPSQYLALESARIAQAAGEAADGKALRRLSGASRQTLSRALKRSQRARLAVRQGGRWLCTGWLERMEKAQARWGSRKAEKKAELLSKPTGKLPVPGKADPVPLALSKLKGAHRQGMASVMSACPWLDLGKAGDKEALSRVLSTAKRLEPSGPKAARKFYRALCQLLRKSPPERAFGLEQARRKAAGET